MDRFDSLQLGFELLGPGTVWIDDITMYNIALTKEETNELLRLVSSADLRHSTKRFSDLLTILDGYAARFLARHVPDALPDLSPPCRTGRFYEFRTHWSLGFRRKIKCQNTLLAEAVRK